MGWAGSAVMMNNIYWSSRSDSSKAYAMPPETAEQRKARKERWAREDAQWEARGRQLDHEIYLHERKDCLDKLNQDLCRMDSPSCCSLLARPEAKFYQHAEKLRVLNASHGTQVPPMPERGSDTDTLRAWVKEQASSPQKAPA